MSDRDIKPENIDLAAIRARAEAAAPWWEGGWRETNVGGEEVRRHIAGCDPQTVLALLDRLEAAERARKHLMAHVEWLTTGGMSLLTETAQARDAALATVDRLSALHTDTHALAMSHMEDAERLTGERDDAYVTIAKLYRQLSAATIAQGRAEGEAEGLRIQLAAALANAARTQTRLDMLEDDTDDHAAALCRQINEAWDEVARLTREADALAEWGQHQAEWAAAIESVRHEAAQEYGAYWCDCAACGAVRYWRRLAEAEREFRIADAIYDQSKRDWEDGTGVEDLGGVEVRYLAARAALIDAGGVP